MTFSPNKTLIAALVAATTACGESNRTLHPIFIEGRAVETKGDTLIAMTRSGFSGLLVRNNQSRSMDTLGMGVLNSPVHLQAIDDGWLVSDSREGSWWIRVLNHVGQPMDSIGFGNELATPNQFAGLPDGRVVFEVPGGVLMETLAGVTDTFAITDENVGQTGMLVALAGGVLHAVPDKHVTLYNAFGNPRWQLEWQWRESAVFTDIAVDANGRPHMIAAVERDQHFVVYSLDVVTGEIVRWSEPGPDATFLVERLGNIKPDDPSVWVGQR